MGKVSIENFQAQAGKWEARSPWVEVTQELIDTFADATLDHQFIHVDEKRAKAETPFGGTIAHGFLSLSLLSKFISDVIPQIENKEMVINYGFDKIRFLMPVPSGSRLRGHIKLIECNERKPGEYLSRYDVAVEIDNIEKPALVAEWLGLTILKKD
jgi:acyl dehydratase